MAIAPRLVGRHEGIVDLAISNRPSASSYRVSSATSLNNAYSLTATGLMLVPKGDVWRSPRLVRNGRNRCEESNSGLTRIMYDPSDYSAAGGSPPGDGVTQYLITEELYPDGSSTWLGGVAGATTAPGILVVPPPDFFATGRASLVLTGTAPAAAALASGFPPPTAMKIALPRYADAVQIQIATDDAFVSFGPGRQEITITAGTTWEFAEPGASEIYIRCAGGDAATFQMVCTLVNGLES